MSFQLDAMFATLLPADEEIATLYEKILEISASCVSFISFNLALPAVCFTIRPAAFFYFSRLTIFQSIDRTAEVKNLQEKLKQLDAKSGLIVDMCR